MGFKKRRKFSRQRGLSTFGKGARQGTRGSGNKGGKGMAGTGKKGGAKKQFALRYALKHGYESYFGRRGFTSDRRAKKEQKVMNLEEVQRRFDISKKIEIPGYKILSDGEGFKGTIVAKSASASAIEKMEKAGGKIVVEAEKEEKVVEKKEMIKKEEKVVEKKKK